MPQPPLSIVGLIVLAVILFAATLREPAGQPMWWPAVVYPLRVAAALAGVVAIFSIAFDLVWVVRH